MDYKAAIRTGGQMTFQLPQDVRLATDADVPALRCLVNSAYSELADLGLNFTGTYQDEAITRERMLGAEVFLLYRDGELVASLSATIKGDEPHLYINQVAVRPDRKRQGLGRYLLDLAEARASASGLSHLRLDTAVPAAHLVEMYRQRGYQAIDEVQWDGKTYRSCIMEKRLPAAPT
jgi:ribosomal protein S18 acetylase RimI-like enzyme